MKLLPVLPVIAETADLSDKTAEFHKCPANFVSLPDSMSDEKLIQTVFLGDLVFKLMKIAHISCIFSIKFAVFTECGKTSVQTNQSPVIFVRQFSFLSHKNFQSVGQLSGNISEDFVKTVLDMCKNNVFLVYI